MDGGCSSARTMAVNALLDYRGALGGSGSHHPERPAVSQPLTPPDTPLPQEGTALASAGTTTEPLVPCPPPRGAASSVRGEDVFCVCHFGKSKRLPLRVGREGPGLALASESTASDLTPGTEVFAECCSRSGEAGRNLNIHSGNEQTQVPGSNVKREKETTKRGVNQHTLNCGLQPWARRITGSVHPISENLNLLQCKFALH